MPEFRSAVSCPPIPDDLTAAQFILDSNHPNRPIRRGNVPWLIEDSTGRKVEFEEIRLRTHALANALHLRYGVGENDVVCIFSPNHVDYPVAIWAAHRLGAIVSCANPSYTADELLHQLVAAKAFVMVAHPDCLPTALAAARQAGLAADHIFLMDELRAKVPIPFPTISDLVKEGLSKPTCFVERRLAPGEGKTKLAFLSFSSGTTGKPKAVAIPHYAVISQVIQGAVHHKVNEDYTTWEKRRFRPGDIAVGVLPFFHIYGLVVNLHFLLFSGITVVVIPKFNFVDFLKSIDKYRIQHLLVVPPQIVLLCKHPAVKKYDLSHVRSCMSGAAPLSRELTEQLIKVLPNAQIGQGYGMTETAISAFPITQWIGTPGSVGQLIPGCTARVVKADGTLADYEEEGELHVSGPQIALGYTNDEKASRETFVDGWLRTGDVVKFAKDGDIFIVGRVKEILKVRGFQVAPAELEGHLLDHPDVSDVCVVGIPDDYSGEVPLAFVMLDARAAQRARRSNAEAEKIKKSIMKHVSDSKVPYKWLKGGVEFIDVIPKNPSGKLLRRQMEDKAKEIAAKRGTKARL
ncbi:acetyl-CoA synthetase-like protein [Fomitiporia mediterranea MF3/22]|uniref:acetyl-CoA synthetase-like protein n=1 Tax=Fomitiporia mediterranea (strain MF3/22) TaxID=694068 RepID=UPI0004407A9A|nr:acetyl-CoA synthetase-like protein [Fomitiporia mediterranea MF3/22]EJD03679.1 acetyl-CoA synthetase-like protein [Fomitiporia mediterranea MF3/22]